MYSRTLRYNYDIIHVCAVSPLFSLQERNAVHSELLQLDLPNLVDPGEAEAEKLKQVTARYMYIKTKGATEIQI